MFFSWGVGWWRDCLIVGDYKGPCLPEQMNNSGSWAVRGILDKENLPLLCAEAPCFTIRLWFLTIP